MMLLVEERGISTYFKLFDRLKSSRFLVDEQEVEIGNEN